jgi:hypothetical protein
MGFANIHIQSFVRFFSLLHSRPPTSCLEHHTDPSGDYCDVYLTHDSMSVRKAHNSGRNHLRNVVDYYQRTSPHPSSSSASTSLLSILQPHTDLIPPRNRPRKSPISNRLHHLLLRRRRPIRVQPDAEHQPRRRHGPPLPAPALRPRHATHASQRHADALPTARRPSKRHALPSTRRNAVPATRRLSSRHAFPSSWVPPARRSPGRHAAVAAELPVPAGCAAAGRVPGVPAAAGFPAAAAECGDTRTARAEQGPEITRTRCV